MERFAQYDKWDDFIASVSYLHRTVLALIERTLINANVEKDLFVFGLSLSDSLMTFLKSNALGNAQVDQTRWFVALSNVKSRVIVLT